MIKAVNLNKTYYQGKLKIEAVRKANLEIPAGKTMLITGSSGAGKSTLLHLLGGLDKPSKGTLYLDGFDFYNLPDNARSRLRNEKMGFIFQFYNLLGEFTILENVMLPAIMKRGKPHESRKDVRRRSERLLQLVGLGTRMQHRPSELSGGESQRAAIARSLVNSPEVLLCDEPTGNLDSKIGREIIDCLWALVDEKGMALVIVSHDENIHDGFDKRYRIRDGEVEELAHGTQGLSERQVCRQK